MTGVFISKTSIILNSAKFIKIVTCDLNFSGVLIFQRVDSKERGRLESSTVMHEISVLPVVGRADNAVVNVSERHNPIISSRIVILSQRVPRLVACVRC